MKTMISLIGACIIATTALASNHHHHHHAEQQQPGPIMGAKPTDGWKPNPFTSNDFLIQYPCKH